MNNGNDQSLELFAQLVASETDRCNRLLAPYLQEADTNLSQAALAQVARLVGELGARLSVFEQASEEGLLNNGTPLRQPMLFGRLDLEPDAFPFQGLHGSERDTEGAVFRWTRVPEIDFELPAYRATRKTLRIGYSHIIKPEYLKQIGVSVDGADLRARVRKRRSGGGSIEVPLPPFQDFALTRVKLTLPAVHAPSELTDSVDNRLLGIALTRISLGD